MTPTIMCYTKNRKNFYVSAFSMIELMIVMAIIMLLVGMSVSTYHKIRSSSVKATCMSNLKSISYSMNMYMNDYGGYMLPYQNSAGDRWPVILVENEYLHEGTYFEPVHLTEGSAREVGQEPLYCPEDLSDQDIVFNDKYAAGGSYAINKDISSASIAKRKWSHIQNANSKVLLCDYNQLGVQSNSNYMTSAGVNANNWSSGGTDNNGTVGYPHFGGSNCLFADWHVELKDEGTLENENFSLEMNYK